MAIVKKFIETVTHGSGARGRGIAKRSDGEYWVVYYKDAASPSGISNRLAYTPDDGDNWTKYNMYGGSNAAGVGGVCVDSQDIVYAFYFRQQGFYCKVVAGGSHSLGSEQYVRYLADYNTSIISNPVIDSSDILHFVMWNKWGVDYHAHYYGLPGDWHIQSIGSGANQNYNVLVIDSQNNLHVLYRKKVGSTYSLVYRKGTYGAPYSWSSEDIIDSDAVSNHWGTPNICLNVNEDPIIVARNHGYGYKSSGVWVWENLGIQTYENISNSKDDTVHISAQESNLLKYRARNGSWDVWRTVDSSSSILTGTSLLWAKFPQIQGKSTNIAYEGTVLLARCGYDMNFYFLDTVWEVIRGEAQLKSWTTRVTRGGVGHQGINTTWYRSRVGRFKG